MTNDRSEIKQALNTFFRVTTLHGFKYLCSKYYYDRVGWIILCCASAICAALLCPVLWARFMEVPALLELVDMPANEDITQFWPQLTICPPVLLSKFFMSEKLGMNFSTSNRLSRTVSHVLTGKPTAQDQLDKLDKLLAEHNLTLYEVLHKHTPACHELIVTCRWEKSIIPCQFLFEKEIISAGACCIMNAERAYNRIKDKAFQPTAFFEQNRKLDVLLQCTNTEFNIGCEFSSKYFRETNVQSVKLAPGYIYNAQLILTSIPISSTDEFVQSECVKEENYSYDICMARRAEEYCGCADPVWHKNVYEMQNKCTMTQLACLRTFESNDNSTYNKCLPSCDNIISNLNLDSMPLDVNTFTLDPVYAEMNKMATVLHIRLNIALSRNFRLNPTETWFTLLSSLGGVFNMFLGVGLFSALEVLFFFFIKLPIALNKSSTIQY